MTDMSVCKNCGNPVAADASFCKTCGAPVEGNTPKAASNQGAVEANASVAVCSSCGKPAANPDQKFCASCGGAIVSTPAEAQPEPARAADTQVASMPKSSMPMPQPVVNPVVPSVATESTVTQSAPSIQTSPVPQPNGEDFQSKLNSFMGASIDTSKVGVNFNPDAITLDGDDTSALSNAFAFFGKSFDEISQPAYSPAADLVKKRRRREEDMEAKTKEKRDFSAHEGYLAYGSLATKLQPAVSPSKTIVESLRDEALRNTKKSRLKHRVQLGEMEQSEAVEEAANL